MNFSSSHLVVLNPDGYVVSLYAEGIEKEYQSGNIYIVRNYEVKSNQTELKIDIINLSERTTLSHLQLGEKKRLLKIKSFILDGKWQLRFEYADDRFPPNTKFLFHQIDLEHYSTFSDALQTGINEVMKQI